MEFATHNGNRHVVTPAIHPALSSAQIKEEEPKHSRFKGLANFAKEKAIASAKKAKENHEQKKKDLDVKRQILRFQINDIRDSESMSPRLKFDRIQELMQRNKKILTKDDYKLYNNLLQRYHKEMSTPPKPKQPEPEKPKENHENHAERLKQESEENKESHKSDGFDFEMQGKGEEYHERDCASPDDSSPEAKISAGMTNL